MEPGDLQPGNASLIAHFKPGLDRKAVSGFVQRFRGSEWRVSQSSACYPTEGLPENTLSPCAKSPDALFLAVFDKDATPQQRVRFRAWLTASGLFSSIDCPACPSTSPSP
jgi:hypothetical protein